MRESNDHASPFADDLLVFSDGSSSSMSGISEVLNVFKSILGLDMNAAKSEIFFSGYTEMEAAALSSQVDIKEGSFPYLGLPLSSQRLSISVMQPFIEKIRNKLNSFTVRFLSFAGKIKLVSSVIYGMVNFWSQVYSLPKAFYTKVDSMCSAFLWKNKTDSASGARVAWRDVCKPRSEGGLGVRNLHEFEVVFKLKQVWNLFANSGSLWVAWMRGNIFGRRGFWATPDSPRFSKTIRAMLQLKPFIATFLKCEIGNGVVAAFWWDSWTTLGPLIYFVGQSGPRMLRLRLDAPVKDAVRNGNWQLPNARSDAVQALQIHLTTIPAPSLTGGEDSFLWRLPSGNYSKTFSSKGTWEQLRIRSQRLPTRDRLLSWGMNVPEVCPLCSSDRETHDHLFFECSLSHDLWEFFAARLCRQTAASSMVSVLAAMLLPPVSSSAHTSTLMKLLLQVTVYALWRERNARIFTTTTTTLSALKNVVDRTIRDRLLSFPSLDGTPSLLESYFACISYPL
ncbi:unnamed protein product [Microthlaspi erraticum]|uniref:Reverse transcriptase domain-containing protein n=1 Tax=Microthlaspi erraticum TaxID=1685480 RepID=A0A6D2HFD2_9BRAS|nr:unnamed protein product [Microthlaspi erraticum]